LLTISASLVLYNNPPAVFEPCIRSWLASPARGELIVVDNSPQPIRSALFDQPGIRYLQAPRNIGFGAAHNIALAALDGCSDLHIFLNPDVVFGADTLGTLSASFEQDHMIAAAMPRILYPDRSQQKLCKLLPTPFDLIVRRFLPNSRAAQRRIADYELHRLPADQIAEVPSISGCFLVARTRFLPPGARFDERFFMYMEDVDLVRRLNDHGKVMYLPNCEVTHEYAKGSYRSRRLLVYHIISAVRYFNKWGWISDPVRDTRNRSALQQIDRE
jgi:GT2 family glycosyltransferase